MAEEPGDEPPAEVQSNEHVKDFFLDLALKGKDAWNVWRRDPANRDVPVTFAGIDFSEAPRAQINFEGFEFGDYPDFSDAEWQGVQWEVIREQPKIFKPGRACFIDAAFGDGANFVGVAFGDGASFSCATLGDGASFIGAAFGDFAYFTDAAFGNEASFSCATFGDFAIFEGAAFGVSASFSCATFGNGTFFDAAAFGDNVFFNGSAFGHAVRFRAAVFHGRVHFTGDSIPRRGRGRV